MANIANTVVQVSTASQQAIFDSIGACAKQENAMAKLGEKVGALKNDAWSLTLEYVKAACQAAEAVQVDQQTAIVDDALTDLCNVRKNQTGGKSKADDAVLNRLVTYKSLILKNLRERGTVDNASTEEKAAAREQAKAERASKEQEDKINAENAQTLRPLSFEDCAAFIFTMARSGTLDRTQLATGKHLAATLEQAYALFHGQTVQAAPRHMGDVEQVQPALTH